MLPTPEPLPAQYRAKVRIPYLAVRELSIRSGKRATALTATVAATVFLPAATLVAHKALALIQCLVALDSLLRRPTPALLLHLHDTWQAIPLMAFIRTLMDPTKKLLTTDARASWDGIQAALPLSH